MTGPRQSFPTVLEEVESEQALESFGPLQHLGVTQRASCIMVSHANAPIDKAPQSAARKIRDAG
jgi:hypothetical protein